MFFLTCRFVERTTPAGGQSLLLLVEPEVPKGGIGCPDWWSIGLPVGNVHVLTSGWLGPTESLVFKGAHAVDAISWRGRRVAWLSASGARVYDVAGRMAVGTIKVPGAGRAVALAWIHENSLALCSQDTVYVARIVDNRVASVETMGRDEGGRPGTIVAAASTTANTAAVMRLVPGEAGDAESEERDANSGTGSCSRGSDAFVLEEIVDLGDSATAIVRHSGLMPGVPPEVDSSAPVYHVSSDCFADVEPMILFYVQLKDDVLVAAPLDTRARLRRLCEEGLYDRALALIRSHESLSSYERQTVELCMKHFVDSRRDFRAAGLAAPDLLRGDLIAWEKWVAVFARAKQTHHIASKIPCDAPLLLSKSTYDLVIKSCLQLHELDTVELLVERWPGSVYDAGSILDMVSGMKCGDLMEERQRMRVVARLNEALGQHDRAVEALVLACDPRVFEYAGSHTQYLETTHLARLKPVHAIIPAIMYSSVRLFLRCGRNSEKQRPGPLTIQRHYRTPLPPATQARCTRSAAGPTPRRRSANSPRARGLFFASNTHLPDL